jgi:Zn-dependent protease
MAQDHWDLGTWNRIPVTMHWTVLLNIVWLYLMMPSLIMAAVGSVAALVLYMAHEFGHVAILRWKKIPVASINLTGLHGETTYGYAKNAWDTMLIAWGGVLAQLAILALAWFVPMFVDLNGFGAVSAYVVFPVLFVFTRFNLFLIIVALLPIGPFDGREAWRAIPLIRSAIRKRIQKAREPTPEQRKEFEARSHSEATDLMDRLMKKSDKEDA